MKRNNSFVPCATLALSVNEPEYPLTYEPKTRSIGLTVLDGGYSRVILRFCPFCGSELLSPLDAEWFDRLEESGLEPGATELPEIFESDQWWRGRFRDYGDRFESRKFNPFLTHLFSSVGNREEQAWITPVNARDLRVFGALSKLGILQGGQFYFPIAFSNEVLRICSDASLAVIGVEVFSISTAGLMPMPDLVAGFSSALTKDDPWNEIVAQLITNVRRFLEQAKPGLWMNLTLVSEHEARPL